MGKRICSQPDCDATRSARGLCGRHYARWRRGTLKVDAPLRPSDDERFWSRVDAAGDCWEWTGTITNYGYGVIRYSGRSQLAHRLIWELLVGPIPDDLTIDHLCRNRRCVNPDHLEPVTREENLRRGYGYTVTNARKTHCKRGHPLSGENLYQDKAGFRQCRTCKRLRQRGELKV